MKTIFSLSALALAMSIPALAQQAPAPAAGAVAPQQAPAMLIYEDGTSDNVFIVAATKTMVRFKPTPQAIDTEDINISSVQAVYILEPKMYREEGALCPGESDVQTNGGSG